MEALTAYYGLDYLASATAIGGMYFLGDRRPAGFVLMGLSSLCMIAFALVIASPPILVANGLNLAVSVRGLWKWRGGGAG